jgi:flagellar basal-body rod protein FlgB
MVIGERRMDPSQISLFALAEKRLAWTDHRQTVLAENIANADTPGWRARDMSPFATLLAGKSSGLTLIPTAAGHLPGRPPEASTAKQTKGEHAPDGNSVRLDVELSKVVDTESAHEITTDLYMKYIGFFRTALGK